MARKRKSTNPLKKTNFTKYKSRILRGSWLARAKKLGIDIKTVPSPKQIEAWLNDQIPFKCYYTNKPLGLLFEVDHLQPISRGGDFAFTNLGLATPLYNGAKGSLNEKEFKQILKVISKWPEPVAQSLLQRLRRGHF